MCGREVTSFAVDAWRRTLRVARLIEIGVDDLLAGRHMSSRVCPHCGHPPDDPADEETVITDRPPIDACTVLGGAGDEP